MVAAMSNIKRVSVIQRRENNDNKDNTERDNNDDDDNKTVKDVTSSLEVVTARPSNVTKCCDDIPSIQSRISCTDSDFAIQSKKVQKQTCL